MPDFSPVAKNLINDQLLLLFRGGSSEEAAARIDQIFAAEGYELEEKHPGVAVYGRGSKTARFLGGGLSGRQEFRATVEAGGDLVFICIAGTASVLSAGAMGVSKMRKELARLEGCIRAQVGDAPGPAAVDPQSMGPFAQRMTPKRRSKAGQYAVVIIVMLIIAVVVGIMAAMAATR